MSRTVFSRALVLSACLFSSTVFSATKADLINEAKRLYDAFHQHGGSFEKFADIIVDEYEKSPKMNPQNCSIKGQMFFNAAYRLEPHKLFGKKNDDGSYENLLNDADDIKRGLAKLFNLRNDFTQAYADLAASKGFEGAGASRRFQRCGKMVQVVNRTIRAMEDLYGLRYLELTGQLDPEDQENYAKINKDGSDFPYTLVRDKYKAEFDKKGLTDFVISGDVFLVRNDNFSGAIISRIGGNDNQFSHLAIAYTEKDGSVMGPENIGKKYIVEAVPDKGLYILPFDEFMAQDKARLAFFRLKHLDASGKSPEAEIAHIAAKHMAGFAAQKNVTYNFSMDMGTNPNGDIKSVFCSQAWAEGMAFACTQPGIVCEDLSAYIDAKRYSSLPSPQKDVAAQYPLVWTEVPLYNNPLVKMISVSVDESFSPGDVEMDPRLELISDFKYYPKVRQARKYDVIFSKVFQWVEKGGYQFNEASPFLMTISQALQPYLDEFQEIPKFTPEGVIRAGLYIGALSEVLMPSKHVLNPLADAFVALGSQTASQAISKKLYGVIGPEDIQVIFEKAATKVKEIAGMEGFASRMSKLDEAMHDATGFYLANRQIDRAMESVRIKACKDFKEITAQCDPMQDQAAKDKCYEDYAALGKRIRFHRFFAQDFSDTQKACSEEAVKWGIVWQF
jgi:hypothetical protein